MRIMFIPLSYEKLLCRKLLNLITQSYFLLHYTIKCFPLEPQYKFVMLDVRIIPVCEKAVLASLDSRALIGSCCN